MMICPTPTAAGQRPSGSLVLGQERGRSPSLRHPLPDTADHPVPATRSGNAYPNEVAALELEVAFVPRGEVVEGAAVAGRFYLGGGRGGAGGLGGHSFRAADPADRRCGPARARQLDAFAGCGRVGEAGATRTHGICVGSSGLVGAALELGCHCRRRNRTRVRRLRADAALLAVALAILRVATRAANAVRDVRVHKGGVGRRAKRRAVHALGLPGSLRAVR